jgi:adenylate kinase
MFIYVGGIPGVGKTTIVKETIKLAIAQCICMEEAGGVEILCQLAEVSTKEELRMLPEEVRSRLRPRMEIVLRDMDAKNPKKILIQDEHFVFFVVVGVECGFRQVQPWDKDRMLGIAVFSANPHIILQHRLIDMPNRSDRQSNKEFIIKEQDLEIKTARSQASEIGISFLLIENESPDICNTAKKLLDFCIKPAP